MAAPATTRSVVRAIFAAFMTKSCVAAPTCLLSSGEYDADSISQRNAQGFRTLPGWVFLEGFASGSWFFWVFMPRQVPRMLAFFPPARAGMTKIKTQASLGKGICPLKTLLNRNHKFRFLNGNGHVRRIDLVKLNWFIEEVRVQAFFQRIMWKTLEQCNVYVEWYIIFNSAVYYL